MGYGMRSLAIAAGMLALQPPVAHAAVIFDQLVDLTVAAMVSDFSYPNQSADDFRLQPGASTISDVHWWGFYSPLSTPSVPDNFTIRFFANVAGAPAVIPFAQFNVGHVGRADTGADVGGQDVYAYSADIAPLALVAGTTYWLSIVNDTAADTDDHWGWSLAVGGNNHSRDQDGDDWSLFIGEHAFQLTNDATAVVEPGTAALLGLGLAAIGFQLRRRRAA